MKPIRSVYFDLDYTLLDSSGNWEKVVSVCKQIAELEEGLDPDQLLKANGDVWPGYWAKVQQDWDLGLTDSVKVAREVWSRALQLCGCNSLEIIEAAVRTHKRIEREGYKLYADVVGTIDILKKADIPMALITNGPSDLQRIKLEALGIEPWFDVIVISGELGKAKPDASVFEFALRQMGVGPEGGCHVGDNLFTDVAGAKAAGLAAVWLNRAGKSRGKDDPKPHSEIRILADLPKIMGLE